LRAVLCWSKLLWLIGPLLGCAIGPTRSRSRGEMLCAFARGSALLWFIGPLKKSCHLALPRPFLNRPPTKPCQLAPPRPFVKTKCAKAKCCVFLRALLCWLRLLWLIDTYKAVSSCSSAPVCANETLCMFARGSAVLTEAAVVHTSRTNPCQLVLAKIKYCAFSRVARSHYEEAPRSRFRVHETTWRYAAPRLFAKTKCCACFRVLCCVRVNWHLCAHLRRRSIVLTKPCRLAPPRPFVKAKCCVFLRVGRTH